MKTRKEKLIQKLGMPHGTAVHRLRKAIMLHLAQKCGMDMCYRCGGKIDAVAHFSIEHIIPWENSERPSELFFDINNIGFSHLSCNVGAPRKFKTKCKYGHLFTVENTKLDCDGNRICVACERAWQRTYWHKHGKAGKRRVRRSHLRDLIKNPRQIDLF